MGALLDPEGLCVIAGPGDIQGCGSRLLPGGMAMAEPLLREACTEDDAENYQSLVSLGEDLFPLCIIQNYPVGLLYFFFLNLLCVDQN